MIGIVIPGVPLISGGPITSNMVVVDVNTPKTVNNITLIQTEALPPDSCAALYFSVPPFETLQFIGCVCNIRPSDCFYTGWSLNANVNTFQQIKLVVKMEKLVNIKMAFDEKIRVDINQDFAKKVAKNLYNYLDSFNQNQDSSKQLLVVPINLLDTWYDKFIQKYNNEHNFLMKSDL